MSSSESSPERRAKLEQLDLLRRQLEDLEKDLDLAPALGSAPTPYGMYDATSGFVMGMVAAAASLLLNVVGAALVGINPLRLIQVYLTFPLGERALGDDMNSGATLALGCCLYLFTGMLLGAPLQILMAELVPAARWPKRMLFATIAGLALWIVNFYLILSWLQPLLFGGNWITDPKILPPWVGAATHLVFAWTMAALHPWGRFRPYVGITDPGSEARSDSSLPSAAQGDRRD